MGSSKDIAIGPVAVVSLLLGSLLQNEVDYNKNKEEYLRLAFTATFFAGITQAALGFLRYTIRQYFSIINMRTQVGASRL
jgi:sulfate transporter 1, high-affinity